MFPLAHLGITLGTVGVLDYVRHHPPLQRLARPVEERAKSGLASVITRIDYRLVLVGAMLPDIIDKPIGGVLFAHTFGNPRIFAHTLLFSLLTVLIGLYLYRLGKIWLLPLSFGCAIHLILDQMWLEPRTLLWPLYGLSFEKLDPSDYMWSMDYAQGMTNWLLTDPSIFIPEIVGALILTAFVWRLVRRGGLRRFMLTGALEG